MRMVLLISVFIAVSALGSSHQVDGSSFKRNDVYPKLYAENEFYKNHDIILFFSSTCIHCHNFAPVITSWAKEHNATLTSYTLDGRGIDTIPSFNEPSEELLDAAFGDSPRGTPALFILNRNNGSIYPVMYGESTRQELDEKISGLKNKIIQFESENNES